MIIVMFVAALLTQDHDTYYPVDLGHQWKYETNLGTEVIVEVTEHEPKDNKWVLETRGIRPDEAWPARYWEAITVKPEGVESTGKGYGGGSRISASAYFNSEGYWILKYPLKEGATWAGHVWINGKSGGKLHNCQGAASIICQGREQVAFDGKWIDTVHVSWKKNNGPVTCITDSWYAQGLGQVQGRIILEVPEYRREFTWTLKQYVVDPTMKRYRCAECGKESLSDKECHDKKKREFLTPLGAEISEKINELGADSAEMRGKAESRLREIGKPAYAALMRAAKDDDLEVRSRALRIIETIK